ncbi:rCG63096 [Rattus norvegicus]|uniref:RCG63096 n=1 Tax=Rattus norvegicus TaxID=10116 RepID=A6KNB3_RAT|nr:rCG63096 [Rattus norvegicus]
MIKDNVGARGRGRGRWGGKMEGERGQGDKCSWFDYCLRREKCNWSISVNNDTVLGPGGCSWMLFGSCCF